MERNIIKSLAAWKEKPNRKPLLLSGMRQCGKTTSVKTFGKTFFEDLAYINFEENTMIASIFQDDFNTDRIIDELETMLLGRKIVPGKTLVFFDEIQECPRAITSLKYFCENQPELHLICAGSLLGVSVKAANIAFPVGKIDRLFMYPMSFEEFVRADGGEKYIRSLKKQSPDRPIPDLYRVPMEKYLMNYYIIGGMPEAVQCWIDTHDYQAVETIQENILTDYANDFSKHAPLSELPKLGWIWDSVPKQLAKENNKFMFSHVKTGKRAHDLEDALQWLADAGLVYCPQKISNPQIPLSFDADATYFKVYLSDIGLLRKKAGCSFHTILEPSELSSGFKGALTENYVHNELLLKGRELYFYRSGNSAEIDFIYEDAGNVVPVEVKSADNTRAKSLQQYIKKYQPKTAVKTSLKNAAVTQIGSTTLHSVPLYMLWR